MLTIPKERIENNFSHCFWFQGILLDLHTKRPYCHPTLLAILMLSFSFAICKRSFRIEAYCRMPAQRYLFTFRKGHSHQLIARFFMLIAFDKYSLHLDHRIITCLCAERYTRIYFFLFSLSLVLPTLLLNFLGSFRDMRVLSRVPVGEGVLVTFLWWGRYEPGSAVGHDVDIVTMKKVHLMSVASCSKPGVFCLELMSARVSTSLKRPQTRSSQERKRGIFSSASSMRMFRSNFIPRGIDDEQLATM